MGLQPSDLARLREKAEQLNRRSLHALPKVTPQNMESLVHELRVHQVELECCLAKVLNVLCAASGERPRLTL